MISKSKIHKCNMLFISSNYPQPFLPEKLVIEESMVFHSVETHPSPLLTVLKNYFSLVMQCRIVLRFWFRIENRTATSEWIK